MRTETEVEVYRQLKHLGVPASLKGYRYLQVAVALVLEKPEYLECVTKKLYPDIAMAVGSTKSRVERAIRHAVEYAWDNTDPEVLQKYFGNVSRRNAGKLTNTQFIACLAEYINMEVRA